MPKPRRGEVIKGRWAEPGRAPEDQISYGSIQGSCERSLPAGNLHILVVRGDVGSTGECDEFCAPVKRVMEMDDRVCRETKHLRQDGCVPPSHQRGFPVNAHSRWVDRLTGRRHGVDINVMPLSRQYSCLVIANAPGATKVGRKSCAHMGYR
jgi:hypothetical protein